MADRAKKRGRPTLPDHQRRDARIPVRVTHAERTIIAGKAAQAGKDVSSYAREKLLGQAKAS
jgi:uncharacterized protein (DUF1778 family)